MKKTGRKLIGVLLVLLIAVGGGGCAYFYAKEETAALAENQRYAYAYITSMQGNEVTYMEVDESLVVTEEEVEESNKKNEDMAEQAANNDSNVENEEQASDSAEGGEKSSGGGMPQQGEHTSGDFAMPSGDFKIPEGAETVTTYIPVGVTVHTPEDMKTTFSRLYSGDIVKMLLESNAEGEEVIVEIWMME